MGTRYQRQSITIVLNRPKYPGNIGSTARCMKNMGLTKMIVVGDREYETDALYQMATHCAVDVVNNIQYINDLETAIENFHYVVGTTARRGNKGARQPVMEPREMAVQLFDIARNNEVALIFGPEDRGLTNEELKFCHGLVNIPTSDQLKSVNLSHAVMICCYELLIAGRNPVTRFTPKLAAVSETERMYEHLRELFIKIGFINHENPDYWMMYIRRFFSRIKLYSKEVQTIQGICRHVERYVAK